MQLLVCKLNDLQFLKASSTKEKQLNIEDK